MEAVSKQPQKKKRDNRNLTVYSRCLLTRKIVLPITTIGKNLKENIEENVKINFEGKCVVEGYIKPNSSNIVTYSSGMIERGNTIVFEVVFECEVCYPVEGMNVQCVVTNITKAGIRAESATDVPSPIVVHIAKDHHYSVQQFNEVKEGDKINVTVIGQRFELNDKFISIIGKLKITKEFEYMPQKVNKQQAKTKLIIEEE
jgi:DNA-directed RNA polymerase subunit E'/Rpb7